MSTTKNYYYIYTEQVLDGNEFNPESENHTSSVSESYISGSDQYEEISINAQRIFPKRT